MMTVLKNINDGKLVASLKAGEVGILPTDTVYGLVCSASLQSSVTRLYELKDRLHGKPGTVIAANTEQLITLGITARYIKAVEQFWPNPISVIIPVHESLSYLTQGLPGLAVRVVANKKLAELLLKTGPLLTSSANRPGDDPVTTIDQAQNTFGEKVDFYVDGGDLSDHKSSTIIKIIDDAIEVVREGAVSIDENGNIK